jgi:hypothetical protein
MKGTVDEPTWLEPLEAGEIRQSKARSKLHSGIMP